VFQKVDAYAGDPILSLMERFKTDPRDNKINLSIGLYYDAQGTIPQLQAITAAENRLNGQPHGASLYLPMEGLSGYRSAIAPLLFGADNAALAAGRIATIQTLGGSGVGRISMDMICIDLGPNAQEKPGDSVVMWGDDLPVERIAEITNVSAYELVTRLTSRVTMEYLD